MTNDLLHNISLPDENENGNPRPKLVLKEDTPELYFILSKSNPSVSILKLSDEEIESYKETRPLYHSTPKQRVSARTTKGLKPNRLKF